MRKLQRIFFRIFFGFFRLDLFDPNFRTSDQIGSDFYFCDPWTSLSYTHSHIVCAFCIQCAAQMCCSLHKSKWESEANVCKRMNTMWQPITLKHSSCNHNISMCFLLIYIVVQSILTDITLINIVFKFSYLFISSIECFFPVVDVVIIVAVIIFPDQSNSLNALWVEFFLMLDIAFSYRKITQIELLLIAWSYYSIFDRLYRFE